MINWRRRARRDSCPAPSGWAWERVRAARERSELFHLCLLRAGREARGLRANLGSGAGGRVREKIQFRPKFSSGEWLASECQWSRHCLECGRRSSAAGGVRRPRVAARPGKINGRRMEIIGRRVRFGRRVKCLRLAVTPTGPLLAELRALVARPQL